jgi:hypothetical protein
MPPNPTGQCRYFMECNPEGPVLPSFPEPLCFCGIPAEVKQSRRRETAARAYYMCCVKYEVLPNCGSTIVYQPCEFFQWIDGPEMYDPRILMFPHNEEETSPWCSFKRWVPPPPNPPPMTIEEKKEAVSRRVRDPPLCHCNVRAKIQRPNPGVSERFLAFFRCSRKRLVRFELAIVRKYFWISSCY